MRTRESAKKREKRMLLATVSAKEYKEMDTDGDNKVSPMEFMCRTLVKMVRISTCRRDSRSLFYADGSLNRFCHS